MKITILDAGDRVLELVAFQVAQRFQEEHPDRGSGLHNSVLYVRDYPSTVMPIHHVVVWWTKARNITVKAWAAGGVLTTEPGP